MMREFVLIFFLLILFLNPCKENYAQDNRGTGVSIFPLLCKERVRERLLSSSIKPDATYIYSENKKQKSKEDKWLGWDKAGHFFVSGFLAGASYSVYHKSFNNTRESSVYFSSILTLSIGIGKEVNDRKKPQNRFSYKDLIYDILGISAGLLIAAN